jgi:histidinol-phosphate aminotransferase
MTDIKVQGPQPSSAVRRMKDYHPPLGDRSGLRLDFNENTFACSPRVLESLSRISRSDLTRYPEREPVEARVAAHLGLRPQQVLITNGVDEAIHVLCQTYLDAGTEILIPVPTYTMYEVYASATPARVFTVPAEEGFRFPLRALLKAITPATRLIAIANPNSPTGQTASGDDLLRLIDAAPRAAVLIDEAYFHFYGETVMDLIGRAPNVIVARTFSKAYGLAGLRLGVLAAAEEQMQWLRRAISPYSVNSVALTCLRRPGLPPLVYRRSPRLAPTLRVRPPAPRRPVLALPSQLCSGQHRPKTPRIRHRDAHKRCSRPRPLQRPWLRRLRPHHPRHLRANGAGNRCPRRVSRRNPLVCEHLRSRPMKKRTAAIDRKTAETEIRLRLTIEGQGRYSVSTGIRFFDHMLELFTRHGAFDLDLSCKGDLDVDQHHTVEDVGIALGEAVKQALGSKRGILRAGYFLMPMDETLASAAIDFSGRAHCVCQWRFSARQVGDLQTELVEDFFRGFAQAAAANVHLRLIYGRSSHHQVEALFKAFARALRFATTRDRQLQRVLPSTKGLI